MLSLESRGDSNEYTQYTIFNMNMKNTLIQICSYGLFSKGLKNEFETAVVNEPSVFKPLKFYCLGSYVSGKCQGNLKFFKVRELSGNFIICQEKLNFC